MERKEIAVQDTWDLSGLFADQNQFDAAEAEIRRLLEQLVKRQGVITESREAFIEFMDLQETLQRQCENVAVYAQMRADVEPEDPQVQQNLARSAALIHSLKTMYRASCGAYLCR